MKKAKKITEKVISFTLALSLVICMNPMTAYANVKSFEAGETEDRIQQTSSAQTRLGTISNVTDLNTAISSSAGTKDNPQEIVIDASGITVDKTISISGKHVKFTGGTLTRGGSFLGEMIKLSSEGSLTLTNITIDGNNISSASFLIVVEDSTLISEVGTVLQNNTNSAVKIFNRNNKKATFIMNEGIIQNNKATSGAAITFTNSSSMLFQMNGGIIQNNTAKTSGSAIFEAGFTNDPVIEINGGEIKNNKIEGTNLGSTFGTIHSAGVLHITGGTISKNTTNGRGGGIYKTGGILTLSGGTIKENEERFGLTPGANSTTGNNLAMMKGTLNLSGSTTIPDGVYLNKNVAVNITAALTGSFGFEKLDGTLAAAIGDVVATGLKEEGIIKYTITQDDVSKFSYQGNVFGFALDTTNNQIKLAKMPDDPTIDKENESIYANGSHIILNTGSEETSNTVIYLDKNKNGAIDTTDTIWAPNDMDRTVLGNDLRNYAIYGGVTKEEAIAATSITMLGGKVRTIFGGSDTIALQGNTNISIAGGSVSNVYGGSRTGSITGDTNIMISGGTIDYMVYAGSYDGAITGNTNLTVTGGTITVGIFGGGADANAIVHGDTNITIAGGITKDSIFGGGSKANVTGSSNIEITGGTMEGSIYGGGSQSSPVEKNATIKITGGEIIKNVYGGGRFVAADVKGTKSIIVGKDANVGSPHEQYAYGIIMNSASFTTGVDAFEIADDLTEGASVYVALPYAYKKDELPKLIATKAKSQHLNNLIIKGEGVEESALYYDASDATVKLKRTKFVVKFESNQGSSVTDSKVAEGAKVTEPSEPTKQGYHFAGWYKDYSLETKWNFNTDTVRDDMKLYAKWVDDIKPTAKITLDTKEWNSFTNSNTYEMFINDEKTVTIQASDDGSGLKSVQYLVSELPFTSENNVTGTWLDVTLEDGQFKFNLQKNSKQYIYVKAIDQDGNTAIINTEGIVVYTDTQMNPEFAVFNKDKQEDITLSVEWNGNDLKHISDGTSKLIQNVDYTINENVITIKKAYVSNALSGNDIKLSISFKPMGVDIDKDILIKEFKITQHQHTFTSDESDCTSEQICEQCGFVKEAANSHEWDRTWKSDEIHHWQNCIHEGCSKISEKNEHVWDKGVITTPATSTQAGVMTYSCEVCGHTKTQQIEMLPLEHQLIDSNTGFKAEYVDGSKFDSNVILRVISKPQEELDKVKGSIEQVAPGQTLAGLYDVKLLKDGIEIQPNGLIRIHIPITDIMHEMENLSVIYIDDTGAISFVPSEVKGDYIVFITNHFSNYGVIGNIKMPSNNENAGGNENNNGSIDNQSPQATIKNTGSLVESNNQNGYNNFFQKYSMVMMISAGVVMIARQRKTIVIDVETEACFIGFANKLRFLRFLIAQAAKEIFGFVQNEVSAFLQKS